MNRDRSIKDRNDPQVKGTQIDVSKIDKKRCRNNERARLAACYAMPPELRDQTPGGDQLPRLFPREHLVGLHEDDKGKAIVVRDAASHSAAVKETTKTETWGLPAKLWQPMEGEYSPAKRVKELRTAIELLEEEIRDLE